MKRSQLKNSFLLLLTAAIWGSAFVAQSVGMDYVKPFTFNGIRSAIGALFLIPCIFFFQNHTNSSEVSPSDQLNQSSKTHASSSIDRKTLFFGGLSCGIVLAAASSLQQIGISYTSVGKAGFLTAIYIAMVWLYRVYSFLYAQSYVLFRHLFLNGHHFLLFLQHGHLFCTPVFYPAVLAILFKL